jgi:hypothetical protein
MERLNDLTIKSVKAEVWNLATGFKKEHAGYAAEFEAVRHNIKSETGRLINDIGDVKRKLSHLTKRQEDCMHLQTVALVAFIIFILIKLCIAYFEPGSRP